MIFTGALSFYTTLPSLMIEPSPIHRQFYLHHGVYRSILIQCTLQDGIAKVVIQI